MLMRIEFGLVLLSVALAFTLPALGSNLFQRTEQILSELARRRKLSVLIVAVAAVCARAAVLPVLPVPQPYITDEFSHLLLADTLAHGRLTNPTPAMWTHFETIHVIMQPTYASMYPPAQGVALAIGKVLTGHPFVGVCLSVAAMCAAICWMLQEWMAPGWALLGGLLVVMRLGIFSYWADSYWGGAVAATGGALVLGALPRIIRFERARDAALMALGLTLLANSRPYEGLVFSIPIGAAFVFWFFRKQGAAFFLATRRVLAPLALVLILAALATGYYCWRVTGNPLRMPQQVNRDTYAIAPYFLWQSPRPTPVYRYHVIRSYYLYDELDFYRHNRSAVQIAGLPFVKLVNIWFFFVGPVLTLPLVMIVTASPYGFSLARLSRRVRFLILVGAFFMAGLAIEVYFYPHYAAPATCLIFAFVLIAMRQVRAWEHRGRPVGIFLTRAVPTICLLMLALRAGAAPLHLTLLPESPPAWYNMPPISTDRVRIVSELDAISGNQLVLVRCKPQTFVTKREWQWVYNEPDIDKAKIVWAWDLGPAENRELLDYFRGRRVWLLEPDDDPLKLEAYGAQNQIQ